MFSKMMVAYSEAYKELGAASETTMALGETGFSMTMVSEITGDAGDVVDTMVAAMEGAADSGLITVGELPETEIDGVRVVRKSMEYDVEALFKSPGVAEEDFEQMQKVFGNEFIYEVAAANGRLMIRMDSDEAGLADAVANLKAVSVEDRSLDRAIQAVGTVTPSFVFEMDLLSVIEQFSLLAGKGEASSEGPMSASEPMLVWGAINGLDWTLHMEVPVDTISKAVESVR